MPSSLVLAKTQTPKKLVQSFYETIGTTIGSESKCIANEAQNAGTRKDQFGKAERLKTDMPRTLSKDRYNQQSKPKQTQSKTKKGQREKTASENFMVEMQSHCRESKSNK